MSTEFLRSQCTGFLNTPPLWVHNQFDIQQFEFPKLDLSTFTPTAIPDKLRLGHQMEHVFMQLIKHSAAYEILVHNLPIRRNKETLGEIDFIVKDIARSTLVHIEMTYKFYIVNPEIVEPIHRVIGPNKRDAFVSKIEKIKNKQFKLLHSEEASTQLKNKGINNSDVSHQACFKGQLFTPYGIDSSTVHNLNADCVYGRWLEVAVFNTAPFKSLKFYIPSKSEWVIAPHINVPWGTHAATLKEINDRLLIGRAPMIWIQKTKTEFEKIFVL